MTSGLRVDEILADYFTHKEEKAKEKARGNEHSESLHKSGHHKHKRKKKYKKHKKSKDFDNDDDSSGHRRSRSSEHKSHQKDKKNSVKVKEARLAQDSADTVNASEPEKCLTSNKSLPELTDSSPMSCVDQKRDCTAKSEPCENISDSVVNLETNVCTTNKESIELKVMAALRVDSLKGTDDSETLEEGEIVDKVSGLPQETNAETTNHKRKGKKKRKRDDSSDRSSPGRKHSKYDLSNFNLFLKKIFKSLFINGTLDNSDVRFFDSSLKSYLKLEPLKISCKVYQFFARGGCR